MEKTTCDQNITVKVIRQTELYGDACVIIEEAKEKAFLAVNTALTLRNWKLGERIACEHLEDGEKAKYGRRIILSLSQLLTEKYGKGFDFSSLYQYIKFYKLFPGILDAVSPKSGTAACENQPILPWTHYRELIRVEDTAARKWYEQEAIREIWSSRTLHRNIASQYYSRMLLSHEKKTVAHEMHTMTAGYQQDRFDRRRQSYHRPAAMLPDE